jgi:hypothetical protein
MCTRIVTDSHTLGVALALLVGACAPAQTEAPPKQPERVLITDVERFLPFEPNTVSAFETSTENSGEKGVLMMQVSRPRPDAVELDVGGKIQRLTIVAEGAQLTTGGWLLKAPLQEGATFKGQFGEVRITSINRAIQVPAGNFEGCIETTEESQVVGRRVTTVFCPKVGIVSLEAEGKLGKEYGRQSAVLKSHGPKVDINAM